jgi:hypothetical protein
MSSSARPLSQYDVSSFACSVRQKQEVGTICFDRHRVDDRATRLHILCRCLRNEKRRDDFDAIDGGEIVRADFFKTSNHLLHLNRLILVESLVNKFLHLFGVVFA